MTPYQRIMRGAARGTGVRLSHADACALARDTAISDRAWMDDENDRGVSDPDANPGRSREVAKKGRNGNV